MRRMNLFIPFLTELTCEKYNLRFILTNRVRNRLSVAILKTSQIFILSCYHVFKLVPNYKIPTPPLLLLDRSLVLFCVFL